MASGEILPQLATEQMYAAYHKVGTGNSTDIEQHKFFILAGKVATNVCLSQTGHTDGVKRPVPPAYISTLHTQIFYF